MAESELVTTWLIDDWLNWMSLVELTAQENTVCKVTPPNIDTNYSVAELTVKGNCSGENGGNCLIGSICDNLKTCSKYGIDIFLPDIPAMSMFLEKSTDSASCAKLCHQHSACCDTSK